MAEAGLGQKIESRESLQLELPPSCVEFSPAHPSYFLVGTYYLQSEDTATGEDRDASAKQSRSGNIIVFRVVDESL